MTRPLRAPGAAVWLGVGVVVVAIIVGALAYARSSSPTGEPGRLSEDIPTLPPDTRLPTLIDATAEWGLDTLNIEVAVNPMAGGAAVADLDADGDLDLVVANGEVVILLWEGDGYRTTPALEFSDAAGVTSSDIDADGWNDLLVAMSGDDIVIWGGPWIGTTTRPSSLALPSAGPSSGLLAAELSGDGALDIVQLGRGSPDPLPDVLWVADATEPRTFSPIELPHPDRFSLAAEIVDIDLDGLLDIWISRDVGWDTGGDSILSRRGNPSGDWHDVASELGADLAVDAMGVTIADLDGDEQLDAYISDLGDNEQLLRVDGRFEATYDTGAARIRAPGAPSSLISSSWATGAADLNLDGVLDLVVANGGFPEGQVRNKIDDTEIAVEEAPAVLLGIGGGKFVDVWDQLELEVSAVARGLTIADLDGDGDDDIVVVDRRGPVVALRNDTIEPSVSIRAAASCATVGASVTVRSGDVVSQSLLAPHTYAGAHDRTIVTGRLSENVSVLVQWGDGSTLETVLDSPLTREEVNLVC